MLLTVIATVCTNIDSEQTLCSALISKLFFRFMYAQVENSGQFIFCCSLETLSVPMYILLHSMSRGTVKILCVYMCVCMHACVPWTIASHILSKMFQKQAPA